MLAAACAGDAAPARPCASDEECRSGVCIAEVSEAADLEPLPLACSPETDTGLGPGERCDAAEDCARGVCLLAGTCAIPCAKDDQCAPLERCQDVFARTGATSLQPVGACVSMVDLPADAKIMVDVREDAFAGATVHGDTLQLPLDVVRLPGADPTTWFVLEHLDDDSWPDSVMCRPPICPLTLRTRDDPPEVLFDRTTIDERCLQNAAPDAFTGPQNGVSDDDHQNPTVVMIPNGPMSVVTEAGYDVSVSDEVAGKLRLVTIAYDTARDDGDARTLDLNLYWIGMERDEGAADAAVAELDGILEPANISIGDLRHVEVLGDIVEQGATFDSPDDPGAGLSQLHFRYGVHAEQPALFRLSAGAGNAAINVFLVESIEQGPNGGTSGKSGGTPAPPGMHGTGSSGIVIELGKLSGRTLAHEIGHHLGLFHTSEQPDPEGTKACVREPLTDTPECHADRNLDGDEYLTCEECAGAGAENLMFSYPCPGTALTPQQVAILRASPILKR